MANITIPRWILTQRCMPGGIRYGKKPKIKYVDDGRYSHFGVGRHFNIMPNFLPKDFPGIFDNWEYRYWCAIFTQANGNITGECRACAAIVGGGPAARRTHAAFGKCYKRLTAAYKLLLKDKKCVICDSKTEKEKWGVYLCSTSCTQAWCEQESTPEAVVAALQLVGEVE